MNENEPQSNGTVYHIPALLDQTIDSLNINPDGCYVDLTFGGGGHSRAILERLSKNGILFGFDQDADAQVNIPYDDRFIFIHSNFRFMRGQLRYRGIEKVDGILVDLGVSFHHFDQPERGFSFRFDAPLDMRMNQKGNFTAKDIINTYDHHQLLKVFRDYGEINQPHKLASQVERFRATKEINTTFELIEAVKPFLPKWSESKCLAQIFQALRIEVNREMEALKMMLEQSAKMLHPEGRFVAITYHSLEDRLVKNFFRSGNTEGNIEKDNFGNIITPFDSKNKICTASPEEIERNPRSRSAKLRVAIKK